MPEERNERRATSDDEPCLDTEDTGSARAGTKGFERLALQDALQRVFGYCQRRVVYPVMRLVMHEEKRQLQPVRNLELFINPVALRLYCLFRNGQFLGYFLVSVPPADIIDDLSFLLGELYSLLSAHEHVFHRFVIYP